jgi:hypothetical protein
MGGATAITEIAKSALQGPDPFAALLKQNEPFIVRGLVDDWPIVEKGRHSGAALRAYLQEHALARRFSVWFGPPENNGKPGYLENMQVNFVEQSLPFDEICAAIEEFEKADAQPMIYCGSIDISKYFDGLADNLALAMGGRDCRKGLWMGLRSNTPAHNDYADNMVCNVYGTRRITLFPPNQTANLYIGPLDNTPAGRAVTLVDLKNPDFDRHPNFAEAQTHAVCVDLAPGDVLHIPSMWWHNVESLDDFNVMVNFWWRDNRLLGDPDAALVNAIFAWRDLPPDEKEIWRDLLDHYVFNDAENAVEHIPPIGRGVLGELTPDTAEKMRLFVLRCLNR